MGFDLEARRREFLEVTRAIVNVKGLIARAAEEMVVVRTLSQFVPEAPSG